MTLTDEQRAKVDALVGAKVMGLDVRGMHQCYQCEGCWDVDDDLAWTGSGHERIRPVYRVGEGWTPEPDERIIFGCPAHSLGVVPEYTTSGDAMLEVIRRVLDLRWDEDHPLYRGGMTDYKTQYNPYKGVWTVTFNWSDNRPVSETHADLVVASALASLSAVGVDWRAELGVKKEAE
jgi:hypothetical protein